jgi:FAD/FMN-containing dehydrogenase
VISLGSKFAVRNIGHNPNPGFSSVGESGVLLDLRGLNDISLSSQRDVVSVGSGATWGEVYESIERYHLTVVGGRATDVGVGGLILGGMLCLSFASTDSWLSFAFNSAPVHPKWVVQTLKHF